MLIVVYAHLSSRLSREVIESTYLQSAKTAGAQIKGFNCILAHSSLKARLTPRRHGVCTTPIRNVSKTYLAAH
jgi:hypothetical protein